MTHPVTRNAVVELLGTPDQVLGSLNDPREREENGFRFNERWLYEHLRDDPADVPMRITYWHRYDFVATFVRASSNEAWRRDEKLLEALKARPSRLPRVDPSHNPPVTPSNHHRPVSDFKGKPDLGGRIAD